MEQARVIGTLEDEREAKHSRNLHSRKMRKTIKNYYSRKFKEDKNKFKSIKDLQESQNKSPTHIIHEGNDVSSPQAIAEIMSNEFIRKVQRIRDNVQGNSVSGSINV